MLINKPFRTAKTCTWPEQDFPDVGWHIGTSGKVVLQQEVQNDRVNFQRHFDAPADYERELAQDKMILGALKCAKFHGYTGEE